MLVKGSAIVDEAIKRGILSGKDKAEVLEWFNNPVKWGEDRGYYSDFDPN